MQFYNPYGGNFNGMGYMNATGYPPPSVQPFVQQQTAQQGNSLDLIRVTGMEGAKAYQMPPNSRAALFDDTDDIVIIKITDGAGFPSYRRARLAWMEDNQASQSVSLEEYVTRKEFEELKGLIENGKQLVRKSKPAAEESK
jgi:hypothetical protein